MHHVFAYYFSSVALKSPGARNGENDIGQSELHRYSQLNLILHAGSVTLTVVEFEAIQPGTNVAYFMIEGRHVVEVDIKNSPKRSICWCVACERDLMVVAFSDSRRLRLFRTDSSICGYVGTGKTWGSIQYKFMYIIINISTPETKMYKIERLLWSHNKTFYTHKTFI